MLVGAPGIPANNMVRVRESDNTNQVFSEGVLASSVRNHVVVTGKDKVNSRTKN